ncbi:hypothetical protein R2325_23115 [Mycobacteroides chelonae]|nr:hypothetical protein [Mycobacteroides chelonae]MEC4870635.1 hypothetical protein [Mycobacteroides chelonae]
MVPDLEVNDFSIIFEVEKLEPPIGRHGPNPHTHEVQISRIIDRQTRQNVPVPRDDFATIATGRNEDEAYRKVEVKIRAWAEAQPTERS